MSEERKGEPRIVKAFEARDNEGVLARVGLWNDGRVTLCQPDRKIQTEGTCLTSICKLGQDSEECYQEAKKLYGERFHLDIKEVKVTE